MRSVLTVIGFLLCLPGLATAQSRPSARSTAPDEGVRFQPPSDVAIVNATIVDGSRKIDEASLLVRDGRILEMGPALEIPKSFEVIDFGGDYLYPAFIDPYVEFESDPAPSGGSHWNSQVTPQLEMAESIKLDRDKLSKLRNAGFSIVLAAPDAGILKGQSCVISTVGESAAQVVLARNAFQHVRSYPSRGSRGEYPNSPMGAVALIRQTLSDAKWYHEAKQAASAKKSLPMPLFDNALESLHDAINGEQALLMDGTNELYALRADRLAREFGCRLVIRGSGREYRRLEAIAATGRSFIVPIDFPKAPEVESEEEVANASLQELLDWKLAPSNLARLEEAGVSFAITSDGLDDPKQFLEALRKAVEAGLSEESALAACSRKPAELLGISDIAGDLGRGKLANFLRMDGDLFDEKTKLKESWVAGQKLELESSEANELEGIWNIELDKLSLLKIDLKVTGSKAKPILELGMEGVFNSDDCDDDEEEADEDSNSKKQESKKASSSKSKKKVAKLKNVSTTAYGVTGTFAVADLVAEIEEGVAFLTLTQLKREGTQTLDGSITWPDGSRSVLRSTGARRDIVSEESASEEGNKEDAEDESSAEANGQAPDSEKEGTAGNEEKADNEESADETQFDEPTATTAEEADASDELKVELNYPLGVYGRKNAPETSEYVLFQGATIWTCGDAGILKSADLLVHNGKIAKIAESIAAPEGAVVVDAEGMHLSPGIIDCHSHMATDGGVNESGQAVTAEVRIGDFIDPNDITIYRQLAGGVTSSNILHGSANPIGGQNQVIKLRWGALDEEMKMKRAPAGIKFALGENVKQSNRGDEYRTRYPQTRMGVEQIIRDRFEAAKEYRIKWSQWTTNPQGLPPRRDYELEAIAEILEGKRWIHCHSYRQDEILTLLRVLDEYEVTIGSLQHILEGYKVADAMAKHGAMGSSFSDWWAYKFEVYDAIPFNGALMHRAGVVVSFNSDDRELARHLNHEAAKAVKYGGVPEAEALKFVTLNPAKQLRIDDWVGSLEEGKDADLVLWNKSPLSTYSACMQTWIDGRKYFDRDEDLQRREQDEQLRLQLIQEIVDSGAKTAKPRDDDPSYWWARYDEFCHHFDDHEHDGEEEHEHEHE